MAFKMKNPSMAKIAKQAGGGSPMKASDLPPLPGSYDAVMAGDDLFDMEKLHDNLYNLKSYSDAAGKKRLEKKLRTIEAKMKLERKRQRAGSRTYRGLEDEMKNVPSKQDRLK